jgi:hypothetical protein
MKLEVRSDDGSTLREYGWPQMGDWLAQLRDDSRGELACPGASRPTGVVPVAR